MNLMEIICSNYYNVFMELFVIKLYLYNSLLIHNTINSLLNDINIQIDL